MRVVMRVLEGPEVGKEYIFPAEGESGDEATNILVGRDDVECHARWRLSPEDRTVSRAHFVLEVRPPNCYIQDNQSKSGVYLRRGSEPERKVVQETLQTGDRLRLGKTIVGFEIYAPVKTQLYTAPPQETEVIPERRQVEDQLAKEEEPIPPVSAQPQKVDVWVQPAELPEPEFYCVRCGNRLDQLPEEKPLMQSLDFMCSTCHTIVENERRLAEERLQSRYFCTECGKDVTEMARSDGRAEELKDIAIYLCSTCGNRLRQQKQVLGYWIIKRLGMTDVGEVFKVWHPETGRVAALKKMLPIARANERMIRRFQREIMIMEDLKHPNIVQIYQAGRDGDAPVFVFEFVPGGDFTQFISDDGKPLLLPEEVIRLIADSLVGLAYLHNKGYVHRDLKPENILLGGKPERYVPKIGGFYLAVNYRQAETRRYSDSGLDEFAGTWMYMPPEQILNFKYVKPPTDIYAMGVTIYFLLSGYWPLPDFPTYAQVRSGRVAALSRTPVQMILHDRRVPLEERRPDLPPALCRVVNKAIAMKPEDRYQSAEEFRQALLDALEKSAAPSVPTVVMQDLPRTKTLTDISPDTEPVPGRNTVLPDTAPLSDERVPSRGGRVFNDPDEVPPEWHKGDVILGEYEVKGILGEGGRYQVYRVHHRKWNLDLAVQSPHAHLFQTEERKQAFIGEVEARFKLGVHPYIVTCYYVRTLGGIPRIFAELVEGGSLKDWIRDRRLYAGGEREALRRMLDVAIQFAWGLGYIHERGLVHQDVKPRKALFTADGHLKVNGGLFGGRGYTRAYAAPEQHLVFERSIDYRADIWGWGMSVLEMFTGEVTWADGPIAALVLEYYLSDPPADLPRMPQGVADLLRDCFQDDPNQRPQSMDVVAERLIAVYQQEFDAPYPCHKPQKFAPTAGELNNRAVSWLDLGRENEAVQCWQEALRLDPTHLEANFNYGYYSYHWGMTEGAQFLQRMRNLEMYRTNPEYWRLLCWVYLELGKIKVVESILYSQNLEDETLSQACYKPDSPTLRKIRQFVGHKKLAYSVAFSLDGRYVLSSSDDNTVRLWEATTGQELKRFEKRTDHRTIVAFSPDGKYALGGDDHKTLKLWDLRSSEMVQQFKGHTDSVLSAVFSPDGKYILSGGMDKTVRLFDVVTAKEIERFDLEHRATAVAFSPDGRYIAAGMDGEIYSTLWSRREDEDLDSQENSIQLWELASKRLVQQFKGHLARVNAVVFSPDGHSILSGSLDGCMTLWDVLTGRPIHNINQMASVEEVAFSPDGRYAVSVTSSVVANLVLGKITDGFGHYLRLWNTQTGEKLCELVMPPTSEPAVAFSPNGRYVLSTAECDPVMWEVYHISGATPPFPMIASLPSHWRRSS